MISLSNLSAQDNDYIGAAISTVSDSSINVVNISDSDFLGSGSEGLFISAIFNSFIDELNITDTSITGNSDGATIAALLTGMIVLLLNIDLSMGFGFFQRARNCIATELVVMHSHQSQPDIFSPSPIKPK